MGDYARIGLFGRSQSGKSSLMDIIVRPTKRLIVFDGIDERAANAQKEGLQEITSIEALQSALSAEYESGFRLWYHPHYEFDMVAELSNVSKVLLDIQTQFQEKYGTENRPDITLAVDEMADCFPNQIQKKGEDKFAIMCRSGRHKGIHLIGASQRPAEVSTKFRGQLSKRFIFNLTEPRDLEAVKEMGGAHGRELADVVRNLPPLEYIRIENGEFTHSKIRF